MSIFRTIFVSKNCKITSIKLLQRIKRNLSLGFLFHLDISIRCSRDMEFRRAAEYWIISDRTSWLTCPTFFPGSAYVSSNSKKKKRWLIVYHWPARRCSAWGRSVRSHEIERDSDRETLKITFLFNRWYLKNDKSYRNKTKKHFERGRFSASDDVNFNTPVIKRCPVYETSKLLHF